MVLVGITSGFIWQVKKLPFLLLTYAFEKKHLPAAAPETEALRTLAASYRALITRQNTERGV